MVARAAMAACASAARSSGKACPTTGLIRPAAASASAAEGRVIVIEHLTLDGVMQAPGHP
jgi:hypothetical protein